LRRRTVILPGIAVIVLLVAVFGRGLLWGAEGALEVVYPADRSVFPPDFTAPTFLWRDENSKANQWALEIAGKEGGEPLRFECEGLPPPPGKIDTQCIAKTNEIYVPYVKDGPVHSWTPDAETWKQIREECDRSGATVTITGFRKGRPQDVLSTGRITMSVSEDPVAAPIFYRDVPLCPAKTRLGIIEPLPKGTLPLITWRLRDVSKPESRVVMKDVPTCANCHTFSRDGKTLGMDVDGPDGDKGTYMVAPVKKKMVIKGKDLITWNSFPDRPRGHRTIGFLSQISPDGQYAVTTVNESVYVANFTNYKFLQVFYPTRGILAYYSRRTGEMKALPGADDPAYVHCDPTWSPDGKHLVFARAMARDPYPADGAMAEYANDPKEVPIQYDLYRIPFDDGRGGTPEPIAGASQNGMSNTFPKISPDGRWIVFVKCRNGQLMRPDSRLWIVPTAGGQAREMRCNTPLMNSWHSFSPNGRWMVFSSKCNTPYTQMFLTHLDEDGRDSPAILIPNSTAANRAVNLPEFANIDYEELANIDMTVVDWRRPYDRGLELLKKNEFRLAAEQFKKSLRLDPQQAQTHFFLGNVLKEQKLTEEAIGHYAKTLEIDPEHADTHYNLGLLLRRQGKVRRAIKHCRMAVELNPRHAAAHNNLGTALMSLGEVDQAVRHFRKAVEIDPSSGAARRNLRRALEHQAKAGRIADSDPGDVRGRLALSDALTARGDFKQAVLHLQKAVEMDPKSVAALNNLAWLLATCPEDGIRDGAQAVKLAERACKAHGRKAVPLMDTLAAAYAEAGRLPEAVDTATQALRLVDPTQKSVAEEIGRRLGRYKAGKPYRQPR
jgi:tetratricopeptide (TPR) repeat protein